MSSAVLVALTLTPAAATTQADEPPTVVTVATAWLHAQDVTRATAPGFVKARQGIRDTYIAQSRRQGSTVPQRCYNVWSARSDRNWVIAGFKGPSEMPSCAPWASDVSNIAKISGRKVSVVTTGTGVFFAPSKDYARRIILAAGGTKRVFADICAAIGCAGALPTNPLPR